MTLMVPFHPFYSTWMVFTVSRARVMLNASFGCMRVSITYTPCVYSTEQTSLRLRSTSLPPTAIHLQNSSEDCYGKPLIQDVKRKGFLLLFHSPYVDLNAELVVYPFAGVLF